MDLTPVQDYVLVKPIKRETAFSRAAEVRDSIQKGTVISTGPGVYEFGQFVETTVKPDQTIFWEEAAEANTPQELKDQGLALIKHARIMAVVKESK